MADSKFFLKVVFIGVALLLFFNALLAPFGQATIFPLVHNMIRPSDIGDDSWGAMARAMASLGNTPDIYQDLFFSRHVKFQYPMSSLLSFSMLNAIYGSDYANLLTRISWASVCVTIAACSCFCLVLLNRFNIKSAGRERYALAFLTGLATLTFYPVILAFALGQIQSWIDALFAVACLCWVLNRRLLAGIAIALICLIKPQFGLFFLWGLLRRQWSFLLGWTSAFVTGQIATLWLYGLPNTLGYLKVLQYLSRHGESFYPNQSVNGLLNRMFFNGNNLIWEANSFPDFNVLVYGGTLLSSLVMILFAMLWGRKRASASNTMDFIGAAVAFTIASPIAWEHHYGILPVAIIALLFCTMTLPDARRKYGLLFLGAAYLGSAIQPSLLNQFSATAFNFVQSYLLLSALAISWMTYALRDRFPVPVPVSVQVPRATARDVSAEPDQVITVQTPVPIREDRAA